jgi:hypothetical protein
VSHRHLPESIMLVGGTKRADGTLRPVVKIKQGYTPELDANTRTYEGPAKKMEAERASKTGQKPQIGGQVASKPNNTNNASPKKPSFNANAQQPAQNEKKSSFNANPQQPAQNEKKPSFNANPQQPAQNDKKPSFNSNSAQTNQAKPEKPKNTNQNPTNSNNNNASLPQTSEQSVNGQLKKLRTKLKEIKDLETKINETGYKPNEAQLQKLERKSDIERDMLLLQEAVSKCQISTVNEQK